MAEDKEIPDYKYLFEKMQKELLEMMKRTRQDIISLHRTVDQLAPKADAYDKLSIVLQMFPRPSKAFEQDSLYLLDRRIEQLTEEIADQQEKKVDASS